jgi:hypothetical protein
MRSFNELELRGYLKDEYVSIHGGRELESADGGQWR